MSFATLLALEARREARVLEALQAGVALAALFLLLDLFAFRDLSAQPRPAAVALWTPLLFGVMAASGRGLASDADRGLLDLARAHPLPAWWHGIARTLLNLVVGTVLAALAVGAAAALFAIPLPSSLLLLLALAVVGITVVATLAGGLAAQARSREVLLPLLAVPVLAPLLHAGLDGTVAALEGDGVRTQALLMAGYDLLAVGVAWLVWPAVLEAD